jgi:uncharacterized protein YkwD
MSIWQKVLFLTLASPVLFAQAPLTHSMQQAGQGILQPQAEQLFVLANQARAAQGMAPLQWDPALAAAALEHGRRMVAEGPIAHRYGGELDLAHRASQAGAHFSLIEENLAIGPNAAEIHDGWMHSPDHRANLLNRDVDRLGVAVMAGNGVLYAVADYARQASALTPAQVEAAVAGLMRVSGVAILRGAPAARAACTMERGVPASLSGAQPQFIMRWQDAELRRLPQPLVDRLVSGKFHQAAIGSCPVQDTEGTFTAYRVAVLLY